MDFEIFTKCPAGWHGVLRTQREIGWVFEIPQSINLETRREQANEAREPVFNFPGPSTQIDRNQNAHQFS